MAGPRRSKPSGEDLIVVSYPDTTTVAPSPRLLARFVHDLHAGGRRLARPILRHRGWPAITRALIRDLEAAILPNQRTLVGANR